MGNFQTVNGFYLILLDVVLNQRQVVVLLVILVLLVQLVSLD